MFKIAYYLIIALWLTVVVQPFPKQSDSESYEEFDNGPESQKAPQSLILPEKENDDDGESIILRDLFRSKGEQGFQPYQRIVFETEAPPLTKETSPAPPVIVTEAAVTKQSTQASIVIMTEDPVRKEGPQVPDLIADEVPVKKGSSQVRISYPLENSNLKYTQALAPLPTSPPEIHEVITTKKPSTTTVAPKRHETCKEPGKKCRRHAECCRGLRCDWRFMYCG